MYGGVATPLALLHHSEMNGRAKHPALQTRSSSREDSYSGMRNAMRLPPLRETPHRDHGNNGCENEPLLPSAACKVNRNGKKVSSQEENLPPPPLPPHKNSYQPVQRQTSQVSEISVLNERIYLKKLFPGHEIHTPMATSTEPVQRGTRQTARKHQTLPKTVTKTTRQRITQSTSQETS